MSEVMQFHTHPILIDGAMIDCIMPLAIYDCNSYACRVDREVVRVLATWPEDKILTALALREKEIAAHSQKANYLRDALDLKRSLA